MVGPLSDAERRQATRQLFIAFVLLIGFSSGLMALYGEAPLVEAALVGVVGLLVGVGLLVVLSSVR